jgi:hypothetical protein
MYGRQLSCIQNLGGKSESKRPFGRPRRRWKDNIKMDLKKWNEDMDWTDLDQDRDG